MRRILAFTLLLAAFTISSARAELRGKILVQGNNGPASRALITFSSGAGRGGAVTIDDGSYYVPNLPDGVYEVTITYRGRDYNKGTLRTAQKQTIYIP